MVLQAKKEKNEKWDADELINESILDRQQVKDVRAASQRLLDYVAIDDVQLGVKSQQNPVYRQAVYGGLCS